MERRITVAVRIRPQLENEKFGSVCARKAENGETLVLKNEDGMGENLAFQFDAVYDGDDNQQLIYEDSVQELVDHALQGANSTVFTYGQTGSGKTYTILGSTSNVSLTEQSGMFPRVFNDLFVYKEAVSKKIHLVVFLSALELYVEDVMDLLAQRKKIKIRDTSEETLTPGINMVEVLSMEDVMQSFKTANMYRSITSTRMNDSSSRSHALFFIDVFQVPINVCPTRPSRQQLLDANNTPISNGIPGLVRSRVALVDLAGSERVKRSGVEGQGMLEAQAINKSLSALGTTINAMYMESSHIPFRDSKLTKLLKPSFVNQTSRILLIGQISPSSTSVQESQGTLRFCDRVKGLKAGKITGFMDPEEELCYLRSLRQKEELTAELRIAAVQFYYQPQRPSTIAKLKGISVGESRNAIIALLKKDAENIEAVKESLYIEEIKKRMEKEQNLAKHAFAEKMNYMIDEYEALARSVKREKKAIKVFVEEQQEQQDAKLSEAKKMKKQRLKLEEGVEQLRDTLRETKQTEKETENVDQDPSHSLDYVTRREKSPTAEEKSRDQMVHLLVETFSSHATELLSLQESYMQRLEATKRKRSEVRHMRLLSSDIILESTLVPDIIEFMIDRAVGISNKSIRPSNRYSWKDIDGLSLILRTGEKWFPPLLIEIPDNAEVCDASVYPDTTVLSSDEDREENTSARRMLLNRSAKKKIRLKNSEKDAKNRSDGEFSDYEAPEELPAQEEVNMLSNKGCKKENQSQLLSPSSPCNDGRRLLDSDSKSLNANHVPADDREDHSMDYDEGEEEEESPTENGVEYASENNNEEKKKKRDSRRSWKDQEYLMRIYDSPTLVQDLIKFLRGGTVMLKHGRSGKPHRRIFWVSITQFQRKLLWMEPDSKATADCSAINLDDVCFIQLGCFSKVFKRHPVSSTDPAFFRSFSIGLKDGCRTVDIVADSLPDFEAWVVGLSNLVRVDPVWGGKLDITRKKNFERLNCFEASLCETNYIYPTQYIMLKRRVSHITEKTIRTLQRCDNDALKAHEILRGIHPPSINDKGALYLTKGELRFLARNEIDIIRITKIWILLQQMHLIFDDNFTPATTFGVTERR